MLTTHAQSHPRPLFFKKKTKKQKNIYLRRSGKHSEDPAPDQRLVGDVNGCEKHRTVHPFSLPQRTISPTTQPSLSHHTPAHTLTQHTRLLVLVTSRHTVFPYLYGCFVAPSGATVDEDTAAAAPGFPGSPLVPGLTLT